MLSTSSAISSGTNGRAYAGRGRGPSVHLRTSNLSSVHAQPANPPTSATTHPFLNLTLQLPPSQRSLTKKNFAWLNAADDGQTVDKIANIKDARVTRWCATSLLPGLLETVRGGTWSHALPVRIFETSDVVFSRTRGASVRRATTGTRRRCGATRRLGSRSCHGHARGVTHPWRRQEHQQRRQRPIRSRPDDVGVLHQRARRCVHPVIYFILFFA